MALLDSTSGGTPIAQKSAIGSDLKRAVRPERTVLHTGAAHLNAGFGLVFMMAVWALTYWQSGSADGYTVVAVAAIVGAYMAMNIGANDVANNVGPAVGSKALTMAGALGIAAVFEAAGALVAGGEVVSTISKGIVSPASFADQSVFVAAMMAALLAAALWVNIATVVGAPVSTTHSIVGGVMGGGIAAAGVAAVDWPVMGTIAASWVISPLMGGLIAAGFLLFIKYAIIFRANKIEAAVRWIPFLVGIMAAAFSVYLAMKGLKNLWKPGPGALTAIGIGFFAAGYAAMRFIGLRNTNGIENRRRAVGHLFRAPLICAAALLSFAHGSNDVANAVGPVAAIVSAVDGGGVDGTVTLPFWVLAIGALGMSLGLMLYGPKIIRVVGENITKLDPVRAFCVALSASITVIIASTLGLPVSSTHVAVGGVFGVGFLREFVVHGRRASARQGTGAKKRKLVRRRHLLGIAAAWVTTVPASAVMSAALFFLIRAMM